MNPVSATCYYCSPHRHLGAPDFVVDRLPAAMGRLRLRWWRRRMDRSPSHSQCHKDPRRPARGSGVSPPPARLTVRVGQACAVGVADERAPARAVLRNLDFVCFHGLTAHRGDGGPAHVDGFVVARRAPYCGRDRPALRRSPRVKTPVEASPGRYRPTPSSQRRGTCRNVSCGPGSTTKGAVFLFPPVPNSSVKRELPRRLRRHSWKFVE